jgi:hypothetical protein
MRANPMDENSAILLVFRICFYIICPPLDKLICSSLLYIYICVCVCDPMHLIFLTWPKLTKNRLNYFVWVLLSF